MREGTIELDGRRVAYYESEGNGPAMLLIHGNSSSGRTFRPQLDSPLGRRLRMVALDLPGHGRSDPAADPAGGYNLPGYARVVAGLVRDLRLDGPLLVGWSLGGHIALEVTTLLEDIAGILIYGTPPVGVPPAMDRAFLPHPSMASIFKPELSQPELDDWGAACLKPGSQPEAEFYEDVRRTDGQARGFLAQSIALGQAADEVDIVERLPVPLAILHGQHEQLVNLDYIRSLKIPHLWRGQVQVVPDAGHTIHREQPEAFNRLLEEFASEVAGLVGR